MTIAYRIVEDDLTGPEVTGLLRYHFDELRRLSPPESCHVLPIERLRDPAVIFWSAWDDSAGRAARIAACGALKRIEPDHGELKSMRAHPDYRGKGAGKAVLRHMIAEAASRGLRRLSLETGTAEDFAPARALYASHGFTECGPFGGYRLDPLSAYMTKSL